MSAPPAIPRAVVAMVASSRSPTGRPSTRPRVDLRLVPEQDRPAEHPQLAEVAQQCEILVGRLAEPEPGIDDEVVPADAEPQGAVDGALEVGDDLGQEGRVARLGPVVHDHQRDAVIGGEPGERLVVADAPHVVDQVGAGGQRGLGDRGLRGVDAERHAGQGRPEAGDDRDDPARAPRRRRPARGRAASIRRRRRAGRRPRRPSAGRPRRPPRPGRSRPPARRPSPENESGVTLRMPITNVRSPQRKVAGPIRDGAGSRALARTGSVMRPRIGVAQAGSSSRWPRAAPTR